MPGTILVSVLEFMGLLLSSSTSIKVSMGKTEYQISEKGDFSFPLTSLRDDFIVKLQDADGNEISRIGFHSKSIVEKGVWEDIFSLGHGHLHLKLQFILNDEERDRIRRMRQSALKKKHDDLLNNRIDEVSDQYKETSSNKPNISQAIDVTKLQEKGLIKKPAFHAKDLQRAINSKEVAILFRSSEQNNVAEKNNLIKSNPSSVRKIVSAFERQGGLAQDMRSHIKPPPTEYQSSIIETKASSKTQHSEEEENYNKDLTVRNHPSNVFRSRKDSLSNPSKEKKCRENVFKGSYDDNYCSFESSGAWIFPGESRNFCITTGGKSVMGLLENLVTKSISHQRSMDSSILENFEKNAAYIEIGTEVSKHEKIDEVEESKSKNSDNNGDENSGGPVKQVIKVAILLGFGIFVLLTRQRKGR